MTWHLPSTLARQSRGFAPHRERRRFRPRCELLEDRTLLTMTTFLQGAGGYTGTLDTMLWQSLPDLILGDDDNIVVTTGAPGNPSQGLLRFNNIFGTGANQIPVGAVINSAVLNIEVLEPTGGNIQFHRMLRTWTENDTWRSLTDGVSTNDVEAVRAADTVLNNGEGRGARNINVTSSLRAWSYGGTNHGWVLIATGSNDWTMVSSEGFFSVERPTLVVDWSMPEPGTFDLNATQFRLNEAAGTLTITVNRSRGAVGPVSVDFTTLDNTAVGGADYDVRKGTLDFADGQFSRTVTIPITNDTKPEEDESFYFLIYNPLGGAELGQQQLATITIDDNDGPGVLQLSAATYTVNEGAGNATITVTRTRASDGVVSVDYRTDCGSAEAGVDFTPVSGTLVFNERETSKTFTIPIINDTATELSETVVLFIGNPKGGATLGATTRAVLTITDNDPGTPRVFQQGAGGYTGTLDTELRQAVPDTPRGNNATISVDLDDGTLPKVCGGPLPTCHLEGLLRFDNIFGPGVGQIPLGAFILSATLTLQTTNVSGGTISFHRMLMKWDEDAVWSQFGPDGITTNNVEAVSTADATLVNPNVAGFHAIDVRASIQAWANGAPYFGWALISNSTDGWDFASSEHGTADWRPRLSVTVVPPVAGVFQFSATRHSLNEAVSTLTVTVTRINGAAGAASVDYLTVDETAVGGADYMPATGTLKFADGETSKTFTVTINNDAKAEEDETFLLVLANPTGGTIIGENCTAVVTIVDNDGPGILQFSAARFTVNENVKTATITVTRSRASDGVVTVDYFTYDETAVDGVDYQGTYSTLVFDEGVTSRTFTITILNDKEPELVETLLLYLYNPKGGAVIGRQDTATLAINDDEPRLIIQQGRNGYAGTEDTELRDLTFNPQGNNQGIVVDLEVNGVQAQGLLRFNDLFGPGKNQIPVGAIILQATLTVEVTNATNGTISLHRMLVNWTQAAATWDSMGRGLTPMTEYLLFPDAFMSPASGSGARAFDVTASLRAWAEGETNFGWAILNTNGDGWEFRSSEFTTQAQRPFLTVVFIMPGGAPGSAPGGGAGMDPSVPALLLEAAHAGPEAVVQTPWSGRGPAEIPAPAGDPGVSTPGSVETRGFAPPARQDHDRATDLRGEVFGAGDFTEFLDTLFV